MAMTLGVYYLAPWIRWDRGASAPDQAILIDMPARRFYFFWIEIWPQEIYYLTGLLIIAAMTLFFFTSLFGRVWCGYMCPQTVWTDLFIALERLFEGDRNARIRLDRTPWSAGKVLRKAGKHASWLAVALATGGAWVFYFADAPTLLVRLVTLDAPVVAYIFIGILTFMTYMLGGHAREQVCIYMCPWPRIQGAMVDADTLTVSYRRYRGEPRGPHKSGQSWEGRGHCVDCNQCVAVCPVGIDIRDGAQFECISCALCVDACNAVMKRVGLPTGLIGYDTDNNMTRKARGEASRVTLMRIRTLVYATIIVGVGLFMLVTLATRSDLDVNLIRDRNPLFVTLSDGSVRNAYTLKLLNKRHADRALSVSVTGLASVDVRAVGGDDRMPPVLTVGPDAVGSFRILVTAPAGVVASASEPIRFEITDVSDGGRFTHDTTFVGPER
jgi:cytochrome c oxidase accessory protein FixG